MTCGSGSVAHLVPGTELEGAACVVAGGGACRVLHLDGRAPQPVRHGPSAGSRGEQAPAHTARPRPLGPLRWQPGLACRTQPAPRAVEGVAPARPRGALQVEGLQGPPTRAGGVKVQVQIQIQIQIQIQS